jgi:4-diphosphocytidyl-2-C-methyl-D-erythritol kinase
MPTSLRSYSKINLGLAIGPSRADGFHALTTLYQTLEMHDIVTVEARTSSRMSITLSSSHPRVPADRSNTAWRMVEQAALMLKVTAELRIHIEKRLPVQGGLGGGSANAVAALLALEEELGERIPGPDRFSLAQEIGSDVPLFLLGGAVLGIGRGEEVYPLPEMPSLPCVVALPDAAISTPQAYRDWDALQGPPTGTPLTPQAASATINKLSRSIAAAFGEPHSSGVFSLGKDLAETPLLALVRTGIENDFEQVAFSQYPLLGDIKRLLSGGSRTEEPAVYAALSGSGSALFGLYHTLPAAEAALARLRARGIAGLLTRTLPRAEYWRDMKSCVGH